MNDSNAPATRSSTTLFLAILVIVMSASCASTPPKVAAVETRWDDARQAEVVHLPSSYLVDVWDGRVELSIQASKAAETALLTVERRSEDFHYKDCRKMFVSFGPDSAEPVSTSYRSDLDLDVDDKLETFQATVGADRLSQLASDPNSAVILCKDRFELAHVHRQRIADFVALWTGERPQVPQKNAAGGTPTTPD